MYKHETEAIIKLFLRHGISFGTCISRLDAALARLIPRMKMDQLAELRTVMMANNDKVMAEMEKRPLGDQGKKD